MCELSSVFGARAPASHLAGRLADVEERSEEREVQVQVQVQVQVVCGWDWVRVRLGRVVLWQRRAVNFQLSTL